MDLYIEEVALDTLLDEVVNTATPLIEKKHNTLQVTGGKELGFIQCDVTKLRQILFNLLSNAAKFTTNAIITLHAVRLSTAEGDKISIAVSDQGIGMSEAQQAKLFHAFTQADSATTRHYGGTGLGLTISKYFVEMMGGQITISSKEGVGSTFTIILPVHLQNDAKENQKNSDSPPILTALSRDGVVLMIDDDAHSRHLLQKHLHSLGYATHQANGGVEGLRLAAQLKPALITLDVMMEDMDGWTVLSALKENPALAHIPVVMISLLDDKSLGYAMGATDYLVKPVSREQLFAVLSKYLHDQGANG